MSYNNYLQSTHWKKTRENKLKAADCCQICCSVKKLNVHHKKYEIHDTDRLVKIKGIQPGSILGRETNSDLIVLCSSCHKLTHHYFVGKTKGRGFNLRKKHRIQIRRMLERGVEKKTAFWIASNKELMTSMYNVIIKKPQIFCLIKSKPSKRRNYANS